jgi:hypothetical protein
VRGRVRLVTTRRSPQALLYWRLNREMNNSISGRAYGYRARVIWSGPLRTGTRYPASTNRRSCAGVSRYVKSCCRATRFWRSSEPVEPRRLCPCTLSKGTATQSRAGTIRSVRVAFVDRDLKFTSESSSSVPKHPPQEAAILSNSTLYGQIRRIVPPPWNLRWRRFDGSGRLVPPGSSLLPCLLHVDRLDPAAAGGMDSGQQPFPWED